MRSTWTETMVVLISLECSSEARSTISIACRQSHFTKYLTFASRYRSCHGEHFGRDHGRSHPTETLSRALSMILSTYPQTRFGRFSTTAAHAMASILGALVSLYREHGLFSSCFIALRAFSILFRLLVVERTLRDYPRLPSKVPWLPQLSQSLGVLNVSSFSSCLIGPQGIAVQI